MALYSKSFIQNINSRRFLIRKNNTLLNLIDNQPDIDKIYLYAKDPYEAKYKYLINKPEKVGLDHLDNLKDFIEYSYVTQSVYKNIEEYNPDKTKY